MTHRFSAATAVLVMVLGTAWLSRPAQAGLLVLDSSNLAQNIITARESVAQTEKQIQQYKTQLQQYENMLQNSKAPATYIWDQAQSTINSLIQATDTLNYYKNNLGSIDAYLGKFQATAYYKVSSCFSLDGCSAAEWAALAQHQVLASEAQKRANDALFKGLDKQQSNLKNDAAQLVQLQSAAKEANGQLAAIGYANQFASEQAHQLLQIRGLLIAQQNAVATRMQATADKDAQEQAASVQLRQGSYSASPARIW